MSLKGNINKIAGDLRRSVQNMAAQGTRDVVGGLNGTRKIVGYVCDINEDGELKGTVNVQEFNVDDGDYEYEGVGLHVGVKLSAIQDNESGIVIIPYLYSEVVIVQNPTDGEEYVIMYSHAKRVQIQSHESIMVGVIETKDPVESNGELDKDFNEVEETGKKAVTDYSAESIKDEVSVDGEGLVQEKTSEKKTIQVGDTKILIDGSQVTIETSGNVTFKVGGSTIKEEDGTISIETDTANVNAKEATIDGQTINIKGSSNVNITGGGTLNTKGTASTDLGGPFNAIKVCPFSGAPHCGSKVSGI